MMNGRLSHWLIGIRSYLAREFAELEIYKDYHDTEGNEYLNKANTPIKVFVKIRKSKGFSLIKIVNHFLRERERFEVVAFSCEAIDDNPLYIAEVIEAKYDGDKWQSGKVLCRLIDPFIELIKGNTFTFVFEGSDRSFEVKLKCGKNGKQIVLFNQTVWEKELSNGGITIDGLKTSISNMLKGESSYKLNKKLNDKDPLKIWFVNPTRQLYLQPPFYIKKKKGVWPVLDKEGIDLSEEQSQLCNKSANKSATRNVGVGDEEKAAMYSADKHQDERRSWEEGKCELNIDSLVKIGTEVQDEKKILKKDDCGFSYEGVSFKKDGKPVIISWDICACLYCVFLKTWMWSTRNKFKLLKEMENMKHSYFRPCLFLTKKSFLSTLCQKLNKLNQADINALRLAEFVKEIDHIYIEKKKILKTSHDGMFEALSNYVCYLQKQYEHIKSQPKLSLTTYIDNILKNWGYDDKYDEIDQWTEASRQIPKTSNYPQPVVSFIYIVFSMLRKEYQDDVKFLECLQEFVNRNGGKQKNNDDMIASVNDCQIRSYISSCNNEVS